MNPYPIGYEVDYVEQRSRATTFFRLLMAIPAMIVAFVYQFGMVVVYVIAWFALLFTGRWPAGMYNFMAGALRAMTRFQGYVMLLTDTYPPFDLGEHPEYPVRLTVGPPKESYSRVKVFFRGLLSIPVMLISYALQIVAGIGWTLAWFVIVVTGKQPEGLQKMINLGVAYSARATAYYFLVTEDWPPFSPEGTDPLGPSDPASPVEPSVPAQTV